VEKAPAGARLGLWFGLLRGCDCAIADAPAQGKEPKVRLCTPPPPPPLTPDQPPGTVPALHCRLCPTGVHSFCLSSVASQSVHCVSAAAAVRPTVQRAWPACPALVTSGSAAACCRWRASVPVHGPWRTRTSSLQNSGCRNLWLHETLAVMTIAAKPWLQDALLDFYGVPVKAAEVRGHIDRMRLLADKVQIPLSMPSGWHLPPGAARGTSAAA